MKVEIVITVEDGKFNVAAPLHDPILCYGLLEMAKSVIQETQKAAAQQMAAQEASRIVRATLVPPLRALNGNGGKPS